MIFLLKKLLMADHGNLGSEVFVTFSRVHIKVQG